jgi:predicted house-cleaning noncanonical NTP pyrophosphatase (MazG superfamily)
MQYNKLVRDKIPEIIRQNGGEPIIRTLNDDEFTACLHKKLDEEVAEFHQDRNVQELADILEVVYALASDLGISREMLMDVYEEKHARRGGFSDKVFLLSNSDKCL